MGKVQQQFFPDSSRPEILVDLWLPEGSTCCTANEVARRFERACCASPACRASATWVGSGVPRFYLPLDADLRHHQRQPGHRAAEDAGGARGAAQAPAGASWPRSSPRCAGRVKLLPNGPPVPYPVQFRVVGRRPGRAAAMGRRGAGGAARQPEHARRQRQLEREDQGAAPGGRPGQGARAGRHQPGHRAGLAHHPQSGSTIGQYREATG
jgi:multidrug efflux pump